jgi:D-3-phosphoglycerate dehydrogenase
MISSMSKNKILILDPPHPLLTDRLQKMGLELDLDFESPIEELEKVIGEYDGLVIRSRIKLQAPFLEKAEKLKFIARYGVGTEHIDLEYAAKRGIPVFNSPEGSRDAVGEHALGMLLMLMNHLGRADREIRQGLWKREPNRGLEIKGKTVGILGYGNMGNAFAQRLAGFEARVIAYDKYKTNYGNQYAEAVSLQQLFEESDILSIHIPYMPSNHYFINKEFLNSFRKNIYLVNTARGLVLNTADLAEAMESGKVIGAAIDVIEYEETSFVKLDLSQLPEPFQYLRRSDRTVLAPHIGGWSMEAKEGHARVLAEKIEAFLGHGHTAP